MGRGAIGDCILWIWIPSIIGGGGIIFNLPAEKGYFFFWPSWTSITFFYLSVYHVIHNTIPWELVGRCCSVCMPFPCLISSSYTYTHIGITRSGETVL
ncbi:hypothetical protein F4779DRAFT_370568 [Xylariaceae sp. FL0662B]|nr:hypothetical protein F4779DRAFT_370568 [Xylariaceae sp. FL0662B]